MAQGKLNALKVRRLSISGYYGDGDGLYLRIGEGRRSWLFRYRRGNKTTWVGLGRECDVSLAEARELARDQRRLLINGNDPKTVKQDLSKARNKAAAHPFEEVADEYISAHERGWKSRKHAGQWRATLRAYAFPKIGKLPASCIATENILEILNPIWSEKPETANRLRGRIESILDYAKAQNWMTGENPARWKGHLNQLLPKRGSISRVVHHAAMPWQALPPVMNKLALSEATAARCLVFLALTATRSSEARGCVWSELDLDAEVWTIPAERMKAGRQHRVPLSTYAVKLLRSLRNDGKGGLVFPGGKVGNPLSDVALSKALHNAGGSKATVHGIRSTFRDWCSEATSTPREVAEIALAHVNRDKVEAAYARSDLLMHRVDLMEQWGRFCFTPTASVIPFQRHAL